MKVSPALFITALTVCSLFFTSCPSPTPVDSGSGAGTTVTRYTVSFETNGGEAVSSQSIADGELAAEPGEPYLSGYRLTGWFSDSGLTTAWDFDSEVVAADTVLYAEWDVGFTDKSTGTPDAVGFSQEFAYEDSGFSMKYCPGGSNFPTGAFDSGTATVGAFWIGETEVTYGSWQTVRDWAHAGDYIGIRNGDSYVSSGLGPILLISWRDAAAWCNALTEMYNSTNGDDTDLTPVYYTDASLTTLCRAVSSTAALDTTPGSQDNPYVDSNASGFRLLGSDEWECAARYIDGSLWNHGRHVSGDLSGACSSSSPCTNTSLDHVSSAISVVAGDYAVFSVGSTGSQSILEVKSRLPNALGCYDMSGNAEEWCFDASGNQRTRRGGHATYFDTFQRLGDEQFSTPDNASNSLGFRIGRSVSP